MPCHDLNECLGVSNLEEKGENCENCDRYLEIVAPIWEVKSFKVMCTVSGLPGVYLGGHWTMKWGLNLKAQSPTPGFVNY